MKELENVGNEENKKTKNPEPLATEILAELKVQNKRIMRVVYVLLLLIGLIVSGFLLYLYQYDFSTYEINSQDGGNASFIGKDGNIYNGERESASTQEEGR